MAPRTRSTGGSAEVPFAAAPAAGSDPVIGTGTARTERGARMFRWLAASPSGRFGSCQIRARSTGKPRRIPVRCGQLGERKNRLLTCAFAATSLVRASTEIGPSPPEKREVTEMVGGGQRLTGERVQRVPLAQPAVWPARGAAG